jgi:hypothetical protein
MTDLARRALDVNQSLLTLGNERFEADGGTLIRNRSIPVLRAATLTT